MNEEYIYEDLSPASQCNADSFLDAKFWEHTVDNAILFVETFMQKEGLKTHTIMFDASNVDKIDLHVTGEFERITHDVLFAGRHLYGIRYYVVANNKVAVSAITNTPERMTSFVNTSRHLQDLYNELHRKASNALTTKLKTVLNREGDYALLREQFVSEAGYTFAADGTPLED